MSVVVLTWLGLGLFVICVHDSLLALFWSRSEWQADSLGPRELQVDNRNDRDVVNRAWHKKISCRNWPPLPLSVRASLPVCQ